MLPQRRNWFTVQPSLRDPTMKHLSFVLLVALMLSPMTFAQEAPADNMTIFLEKIKADKKLLVAENMGLTEAEGKAFWPLYDAYQKELQDIQIKYGKIIERYAENYQKMTDEQAKSIVDDVLMMDGEHLKLRQSHLAKFRAAIPEVKVARFYQIENEDPGCSQLRACSIDSTDEVGQSLRNTKAPVESGLFFYRRMFTGWRRRKSHPSTQGRQRVHSSLPRLMRSPGKGCPQCIFVQSIACEDSSLPRRAAEIR